MVAVSLATHYELYHDWHKAIAFCRTLPDVSPPEPITFHMYWRERHGRFWKTVRPFGAGYPSVLQTLRRSRWKT